ncbi:MAG: PorV/PorQ family protein [Bacteroidetes bacterium]|nr:PorV/PorQ family protein [Bacteroidota bacterium]
MKCVIRTSIILILLASLQPAAAQLSRTTTKVGTTVAQFLKIGAGARSVAMGGSAAAMDGDIYSIYWNPGSLSRLKTPGEASFNHTQWLADIDYNYVASGLTVDGFGTLGLSVTSLTMPEEIVRTEINPDGDGRRWSYSAFSMGLSFARSLTDRFSIGITAKYIHEGIWNMSSSGFAFDIGTIYTTTFNGLKIGASISNFGTKMRLDGQDISFNNVPSGQQGQGSQNVQSIYKTESYDIPLQFRIGLAMDVLNMDAIRATASVDATHPNDNVEYVNSGVEVAYDEMFFVRAGYNSLFNENAEQGLTWGVGMYFQVTNLNGIKVDYAFADYGRLNDVQYVSVSVTY